MASINAIGSDKPIQVSFGGTGAATLTDHGVLLGSGTGAITPIAVGGTGVILTGVAGADPTWTTATYPATVAVGDVLVASGANVIGVVTGAATAGYVLTANGAGTAPTFQAATGGIGTLNGDSGSATGATVTIAGGTNITTSAAVATVTVNLDAALTGLTSATFATGGSVQTGTTATNTLLIQAYDTDLTGYVPFITLTANNTPTCDLSTDVTIGTKYIYRADGTDVAVADGGTGASTLTDHGILLGSGTSAITPLGEASNGQIPIGSTGADPVLATITAGTNITVTNAAGAITIASTAVGINDQTASYQLVAGDAGKLITMTVAGANTLTVPKDATVNFAVGTQILVYQGGAGTTTLTPEDGTITIHSAGGLLALFAQYSVASLVKLAANTWVATGDLG